MTNVALSSLAARADPALLHERATGAVVLLLQRTSLRQLSSRWDLTQRLVTALATSFRLVGALAQDKQETM
jgi:hypothetical protein